ncbi:MAG: sortase [Candidatus Peribacteraceae bacterium]|nr:sortase [Candidatus Peribacteraceae bacterium]MDD5074609.1 sortase [Candidatus Peribacteraceae bacterium]
MIPLSDHPPRHSASYDAQGNIILPPGEPKPETQVHKVADPLESRVSRHQEHIAADPLPAPKQMEKPVVEPQKNSPILKTILQCIRAETASHTEELFSEGMQQYRWSAESFRSSGLNAVQGLRGGAATLWSFLTQPVWIVRPRREPKQYSRMTLFFLDTVRFGGTFAALFVALFITLNYQSFWQIFSAKVDPLREIKTEATTTDGIDSAMREKLLKSPMLTTAGSDDGNLLSYLPPVGPPENRLIIPKLHLNVPIIDPSFEALLKEDWAKVESDIQVALQEGVVHYPGTAKPGQAGNFFVTGHSSYYPWAVGKYKTVFARLSELNGGDEYWVYYNGDKHRYTVLDKKEVKPSNVDVLDQPTGKRLGTLMTCTPVGTTLRRLIITSEEVDPETGTALAVGAQPVREKPKYKMEMLPI